jgi:hypothetical protein
LVWPRTRCAEHATGTPVSAEPGRENVHIVRRATPDGYRLAPRRYDGTTDSFIDDDPNALGIEKE